MSLNQNPGIGCLRGTTSSTQKDHQPGPGQYSIPGSFEQTEREKLQNELLSTRYKGSSPKQPSASGSGSGTPNQQAPTSSSPIMSGSKRTREDDAAGSQNDITKQKISNK